MKRLTYYLCGILLLLVGIMPLSAQSQYKDTLVVARDGSGDYRTLTEAMEGIRAFMDYKVTVLIKNGTYKEKAIIPSWVQNVDFIGESVENTIITYDDHANINKMGTFRTYTVKVQGNNITFKNLTIENNAARLGQAVALHTEGDKLVFINCRLLGNQDTIYTGAAGTRLYFVDCYIEGTTDFIFGPSTALFENCEIRSKTNSYVTAASTPEDIAVGYVLKNCKLTANPGVDKVYLGRPWRPYAATVFINCEMGKHIRPEGWHNWGKEENEKKLSGISSEEIYQSLQQGKTEEIEKIENRLHETEKKQNVTEYLEYIEHILEALSLFDGKLIGETSGQRFLMTEGCSSYDFRKVTDLQAYIEYKIEEICRMKNEKEKMIYSDVTINAMAYINQNYGDASITAAEVAEHVGVTSSWLSTKFKTETGIRVNDFINNVRIENAKKMFQDKEYMVYEVSEKTGFTSSQYFSKIFKEYTGLTPNQYRRKLLAGE